MADLDTIEEARRKAEAEAQNVRAADYTQRGLLPAGEYTPGASVSNPITGSPQPVGLDNPQTGFYTNQTGANLGNVQPGQPSPGGATGIQGVLSPEEQSFWAANPNGAVKDPTTGSLIGLGSVAPAESPTRTIVNEGLGPPATPWIQQDRINTGVGAPGMTPQEARALPKPIPDFLHIPEVNPALMARQGQIQNEIATTMRELQTADSRRRRNQPSQRDILSQRLSQLQQGYNGLGMELHRQTSESRKASDQNRKLQEGYLTDQHVMGANKAIAQIQASPGSPEYKKQLFQIADQYHMAMNDPAFKREITKSATYHDEREAARQRAIDAGLIVKDVGVGQKGVTQKFVDPGAVPEKIQTRYDKLRAAIQGHAETSAQQETENKKKNLPDVGYTNAPALHAQQAELGSLEKQYPGLVPVAVPPPDQREAGKPYNTPKGKMIWTGTGWVNP